MDGSDLVAFWLKTRHLSSLTLIGSLANRSMAALHPYFIRPPSSSRHPPQIYTFCPLRFTKVFIGWPYGGHTPENEIPKEHLAPNTMIWQSGQGNPGHQIILQNFAAVQLLM